MPDWNAPLDEWIKFYSPESYSVVGVEREVPVHRFLVELKQARERLAELEPPADAEVTDIAEEDTAEFQRAKEIFDQGRSFEAERQWRERDDR